MKKLNERILNLNADSKFLNNNKKPKQTTNAPPSNLETSKKSPQTNTNQGEKNPNHPANKKTKTLQKKPLPSPQPKETPPNPAKPEYNSRMFKGH